MSLSVNTLANLGGRIWTVALAALLIPVYVRLLGIEAYALVGISATVLAIFGLLDLGMGAAFSREVSRLAASEASGQHQRDLLASFDVIYLFLTIVVAALIQLIAPYIATHWLSAQALDRASILAALRLIGLSAAFQFATAFYLGGLIGLERQILYNAITVTSSTIRGLGAVAVLVMLGGSVQKFFGWQLLMSVATAVVVVVTLHHIVDRGQGRGTLRFPLIRQVWRYAAGWTTNAVGTNLAGQADKLVLSRVLPLAQFGYYTMASTVAVLLWNIVVPVAVAAFPRFNRSIAAGDEDRLRNEYFHANQLLAIILIPVSAVIVFFPRDVLLLWTRDPVLSAGLDRVMVVFAGGMTVAGLCNIALHLAIAYGWFRLPITITVIAAVVVVPIMIVAGRAYGTLGGAVAWAIQTGAVMALVPILHRRHLRGEATRWFVYCALLPAIAAGSVCLAARLAQPRTSGLLFTAVFLFCTWGAASAAVAAVEPDIRAGLLRILRLLRTAVPLPKGDLE